MKILLCLFSVAFVSVTFAARADFRHYFVKNFDNKDIEGVIDSVDDMRSDNEIVSSNKLEVEPVKRLKRSYHSQPPCESCTNNRDRYDHYNDVEYNSSPYRSYPGENYYNAPPKSYYPDYPPHSYNVPSYYPPNYNPPGYHPSTYNAPSYHQPPYNAPSYHPSITNSPTYIRPNNQQPIYNAYDQNKYSTPAYSDALNPYPHQPSHGIPSSSLLIGCHPHVSPFPDASYFASSSSYRQSEQQKPPPSQQTTPTYRFHAAEDSSTPVNGESNGPDTNELMPEKVPLLDNSINESGPEPVKDNSLNVAVKNDNDVTTKPPEEVKVLQHETLFKMAQFHNQNRSKTMTSPDDKQKRKVSWNV